MKVNQLIHILQTQCKPNDVVMLQSDPEGNGYGHLGLVFPTGDDAKGYEPVNQSADFDAEVDNCVILMPFTTVGDW